MLVITITQSLKSTIIKYQEYQSSQNNPLRSSSISIDPLMDKSLKQDTQDSHSQTMIPVQVYQDEIKEDVDETPKMSEGHG